MSVLKIIILYFLIVPLAEAVGFRVATYNIGAHFITTSGGAYVPIFGIGDPGIVDHDMVKRVLDRIDADVVALQEIHSADFAGDPDDLDAFAESLGYNYLYIPPNTNAFDTNFRVVFLSRFPFLTGSFIGSPSGSKEITRLFPVVKVDVPGTDDDPTIISAHMKSGSTNADRFRRAIEMQRLAGYVNQLSRNYIVMGDFNLSSINTSYNAPPSNLPVTFMLGPDITFPVSYSTNPLNYFNTSIVRLDPRQLDSSPSTFQSGSVLDLFLVSPAIAARPLATEIYNSLLDTSNTSGLQKSDMPLSADTSHLASDHYALFADFELDDEPQLVLKISQTIPGFITLTFPTDISFSYTIQASEELSVWSDINTYTGTGIEIVKDIPIALLETKKFFRVAVSRP